MDIWGLVTVGGAWILATIALRASRRERDAYIKMREARREHAITIGEMRFMQSERKYGR